MYARARMHNLTQQPQPSLPRRAALPSRSKNAARTFFVAAVSASSSSPPFTAASVAVAVVTAPTFCLHGTGFSVALTAPRGAAAAAAFIVGGADPGVEGAPALHASIHRCALALTGVAAAYVLGLPSTTNLTVEETLFCNVDIHSFGVSAATAAGAAAVVVVVPVAVEEETVAADATVAVGLTMKHSPKPTPSPAEGVRTRAITSPAVLSTTHDASAANLYTTGSHARRSRSWSSSSSSSPSDMIEVSFVAGTDDA